MLLFIFTIVHFQYGLPGRPLSLRFEHDRSGKFYLEKITGDYAGPVLTRCYYGAGIEEVRFESLKTGIYLGTHGPDSIIVCITDLDLVPIPFDQGFAFLVTRAGKPRPGAKVSIFGEKSRVIETDSSGIGRFYGYGEYYLFCCDQGSFFIGKVSTPTPEAKMDLEIIPLLKKGSLFYFIGRITAEGRPQAGVRMVAEVIKDDEMIPKPLEKTDRFGVVWDSVRLPFNRLILRCGDHRAVYPGKGFESIKNSEDVVLIDRKSYIPGDTLIGVVTDPSISIKIMDPSGATMSYHRSGSFLTLPLDKEGRYQIIFSNKKRYFFVGRRGELVSDVIPIVTKIDTFRIEDEIIFKIFTPLDKGSLIYSCGNEVGRLKIDGGVGILRLKFNRTGEKTLRVAGMVEGRRYSGWKSFVVRDEPGISFSRSQLKVSTKKEARIFVVISPVRKGEAYSLKTGIGSVRFEPPEMPGAYRLRVIAFGSGGVSIDVFSVR